MDKNIYAGTYCSSQIPRKILLHETLDISTPNSKLTHLLRSLISSVSHFVPITHLPINRPQNLTNFQYQVALDQFTLNPTKAFFYAASLIISFSNLSLILRRIDSNELPRMFTETNLGR